MTRRAVFLLLTALVVATRVADGVTTYLVTPDFGREMNPLASGGWPLLISVAVATIGVSTFLNYRQVFHPFENFPAVNGADLRQFKQYYFDPRSNPVAASRPGAISLICSVISSPGL